jgi:hypothetical protein
MLNIIPGIASALAAGNLHGSNDVVFYVVFTIQWFLIGLLLSFAAWGFRNKRDRSTTVLG